MKILLAIGNALVAIGNAVLETAGEAPQADTAPETTTEAPKRRGRPPGATAAAAESKVDVEAERERIRALYMPLVTAGQGEKVAPILAKYSKTGMPGVDPKDFPALEKDVMALLM